MIRLAIIGTSKIAATFAQAAKRCGGYSLEAVYSRGEATGRAFAQEHGIAAAVDSLEKLGAMEQVDAVYIASPNSCHYGQAMAMLRAKKHVLLEKPAVPRAEAFAELREEANRQGVVFLEAMRTAFDPGIETIERLMGQIGPVRRATLEYSQYSSRYDAFKRGEILNAFNPALANAAVMDIGVYAVYALIRLFGEPEEIRGASVFLENGMEGLGTILARYPGMVGEVLYSKITDMAQDSQIQGEQGSLLVDHIASPGRIVLRPRKGEEQVFVLEKDSNPLYDEAEAFCRIVETGAFEEMRTHQSRTLAQLRVIQELRRQSGIRFPGE